MNRKNRKTFTLPTTKNEPITDMGKYTFLIYGKPKIGKTSLAAQFDKNLLIALEPGYKGLSVYAVDVPMENGWDRLNQIRNSLLNDDNSFKTISLDTANIIYDICLEHVCAEMGVSHPSDVDWGKAWKAVGDEFKKFNLDIMANNYGLVVLAHEKLKEIKNDAGIKIEQIGPAFSSGAEDFYAKTIDTIGYYHYIGSERYLLIRGNEEIIAGTRLSKNFLTAGGEPVVRVPMGNSAEEAHTNLNLAFNNEQMNTFKNIGAVKERETTNTVRSRRRRKA